MIELLRYLEANGFSTYIASGGDRDFMRPFAEQLYGIPPERVIGSALGLDFQLGRRRHRPALQVEDRVLRRRPGEAGADLEPDRSAPPGGGGNSNGDVPMLRFARTADRAALRLLVLHDDPDREFDYVSGAEEALDRAKERSWTVVSVKDDWDRVFAERLIPFEAFNVRPRFDPRKGASMPEPFSGSSTSTFETPSPTGLRSNR